MPGKSRSMANASNGDDAKKTSGQLRGAVKWNRMLEELKAYQAEHSDCWVPRKYPTNPQLGVWVGFMHCLVIM